MEDEYGGEDKDDFFFGTETQKHTHTHSHQCLLPTEDINSEVCARKIVHL